MRKWQLRLISFQEKIKQKENGEVARLQDINMKQYVIKKLAYANNIKELEEMFPGGETVFIELQDEIKSHEDIGFKKCYGEDKSNRKRNKVV